MSAMRTAGAAGCATFAAAINAAAAEETRQQVELLRENSKDRVGHTHQRRVLLPSVLVCRSGSYWQASKDVTAELQAEIKRVKELLDREVPPKA